MPIVDMKKVFLLGHSEEREKIVSLLYEKNSLQLVDVTSGSSWEDFKELLEPGKPACQAADLETSLAETRYCLDFFQRYFPVRKSFIEQFTGGKLELSREQFIEYTTQAKKIKEISATLRAAEEKISHIRNEETQANNLIEELTPWQGLDLPLEEVQSGPFVAAGLFYGPQAGFAQVQGGLSELVSDYYLETISSDSEFTYFYFTCLHTDFELATEHFKTHQFSAATFANFQGTATANMENLKNAVNTLEDKKTNLFSDLESLTVHRPMLMSCHDYLAGEFNKKEAEENLGLTKNSFLLEGWVPEPVVEELKEALQEQTGTAVLTVRDPEPGENVPVLLDNHRAAEPYEAVTRLYSSPQKSELDPTPFLAPFFLLFFGICFSDAGYGLVLALLCVLLMRKLKLGGMGKQLVKLLFFGGLSTVVIGILFGSYFGDLIKIPPLWFNPLEDPMRMLIYCFALGLIHIYFGMGLQAYRNIKAGNPLAALFDQGIWFIFLNGLIMLFSPALFSIGKWLAIGGGVGLILTQGRSQQGIIKKFLSGLVSIYNITGYLSDVLSYSRLLALGLATGVIASAINAMGGMLSGTVVGTIIMVGLMIGGHLFNIVINTLGAYVHTSRLQYIEFFSKFFEGGGRPFKPFGRQNTYVDVVETGPEA